MKYSWIYLLCWADGSVEVDTRHAQAKVVEYCFTDDQEDFYFDYEDEDTKPNYCKATLCRDAVKKVFGVSLKPGEYIELRVTEDGEES